MNASRRLARVAAIAALALSGGCSSPAKKKQLTQQDMIAMDPLPLAKGSKWTYTVTVKRFDPDADKETTRSLSWTTEVLDAKESNGVTAFRVRGWPTDLADIDATTGSATPPATEKTILRHGNSFLFGASAEPSLDGAEGWFSWPVIDGQKICPSAEMVYCWQVTALETGYKLSFYTGPDEQTFELAPGTGVARFHYAHHGTTNEVEAKLVTYSKSGR
ncbi:MAG: hypothetical protein KF773_04675 [Deltaproteobacteria bacterium]|nr:hypothetical protein [Deltaproteobacteria bacterium]MCW5801015.1 hypothetical protein [Deltaproteobacteria bacterium]